VEVLAERRMDVACVEELTTPTPFLDFVEMHCGLWEIGVFGL